MDAGSIKSIKEFIPLLEQASEDDVSKCLATLDDNKRRIIMESLEAQEALDVRSAASSSLSLARMTTIELTMRRNETFPASCNMPPSAQVINGTMSFRELPEYSALCEAITSKFSKHGRFSCIAGEDGAWQQTTIDPAYHFAEETSVSDASGMRQTIDRIIQEDLDMAKPAWRIHIIPSSSPAQLSVVMIRVHHCIGDGLTLVGLIESLDDKSDTDGRTDERNALVQKFKAQQEQKARANVVARTCYKTAFGLDAIRSFVSNATVSMRPLETETLISKPRAERKSGLQFGNRRSVVFVPPHSLSYVKAIKNAAGVSLNDVVLSATTGALRRYCEDKGDPAYLESFVRGRALIPVSMPLPATDAVDCIRNNFCFVSCRLALSESSPQARLKKVNETMEKIKRSTKAPVGLWMANSLLAKASLGIRQKSANDIFSRHCMVFSNVPGPQDVLTIAGQPVEAVQAIFQNVIPQAILISYNGNIHMNMVVDPDVIENPEALADHYMEELHALGEDLGVPCATPNPEAYHGKLHVAMTGNDDEASSTNASLHMGSIASTSNGGLGAVCKNED